MSEPVTDQQHGSNESPAPPVLKRELGIVGATMMGLGAIVGTGVFVSIGIAAGVAGPAVIIAIAIAALVAACNALSSAQLAANHPVSGGTYEYGYAYLKPWMGFTAGWMFLCAKTASAATAALGFAGYLLNITGWNKISTAVVTTLAVAIVIVLTLLVLSGIRRSNMVNIVIVSITLLSLLVFIAAGVPLALREGSKNLMDFADTRAEGAFWPALLHATALMFVAYTGYGRIATLGEEVREPRSTIPRAIILVLVISMLLYMSVGTVAIAAVGASTLGSVTQDQVAPLEVAAQRFSWPAIRWIVAVGAITAMLGVLLNLLLGLSRVLLAMGRRSDMPKAVSRLNKSRTTPYIAVIVVGAAIAGITLIGDVKTTWSFSAFTVLMYYAITNMAALALPDEQRLYPRWIAWCGLAACVFLAFWVSWPIWLTGIGLIALGLLWHTARRRYMHSVP
ncbi:MAG: APC family permease [Phycisphaerales bacterium]